MRMNRQIQILLGLILGIAVGLFFGELVKPLDIVGKTFISLLKMSVLPYMAFALIQAVGSLSPSLASLITRRGLIFFALFWAVVLVAILSARLVFPQTDLPVYHSDNPQPGRAEGSFIDLFIPVNPFHALSNNVIPAVVVFSLFFGAALMRVQNKDHLLHTLDTINESLVRITQVVSQMAPLGVFALVSVSLGTLSFGSLAKLEVYLITFYGVTLLLSAYLIPSLVNAFTPIGRREFLSAIWPAVLLGFTTGNNLVAVPLLITCLHQLAQKYELDQRVASSTVKSIVPIAYNFPTAGNLLTLLYILFLGNFYGVDFELWDRIRLIAYGIPSLFGAASATFNAVNFLIDKMQLPFDGVGLFVETNPFTRNLQAMVSLIGMGAVTALITFACAGRIETSARKLLSHTLQAALLTLSLTLLGTYLMPPYQSSAAIFPSLRIEQRVGERIFLPGDSIPEAEPHKDDVVARIQETGVLRVGYHSGIAPYVYFNEWGELVGHDVALIHNFARAVGVRIDWIPFDYVSLVDDLLAHRFDIAVGSVSVTEGRLTQIDFTAPYSEQELVLVVRDHARHEFYTQEQIHARANLRMAALKGSSTLEILRTMFPQKTILPASSMDILLEDPSIDAYLQTHWEAFTWALTHPQYSIVAPSPSLGMEHLAIAITPNAPELTRLTSYWLEMQRKSGELEQLKHTWVEGRIVNDEPRWSIIRDVLHWVD